MIARCIFYMDKKEGPTARTITKNESINARMGVASA